MKYAIVGIILFAIALLFPWWTVAIVMFVFGYKSNSNQEAMVAGITIPQIVWLLMFSFRYLSGGELILQRVADMFNLNSPIWLILLSLVVPALTGFLSSLFGYQIKLLIHNKQE